MKNTQIFLLQEPISYFSANSKGALPVFIALGILIVVGIIISRIRGKKSPNPPRRNFSLFTFHKLARKFGLDKQARKLLRTIFQNNDVSDPGAVLRNPALLDKYFKRAYSAITRTITDDEELNSRLSEIFALRNRLDTITIDEPIASTRQIKENTPVIISTGSKNYRSTVVFNQKEHFIISPPQSNLGTTARIAKGTGVTISFLFNFNQAIAFPSKIPEVQQTAFGPGMIFPHTNKVKYLAHRMYRRKQKPMPCSFFLVTTEQIGKRRKKKIKLIVDKQRIKATMLDVSVGGCCVKSPVMMAEGAKLKIAFSYSDSTIVCLGRVLKANKDAASVILHIKFIKIPEKSGNAINAMVYDFDE
jgi:c-di-GMP-binding flagellar brake protein YcgR